MKKTDVTPDDYIVVMWGFCWLFTWGLTGISFWSGILALLFWPYFLGDFVRILLIH